MMILLHLPKKIERLQKLEKLQFLTHFKYVVMGLMVTMTIV